MKSPFASLNWGIPTPGNVLYLVTSHSAAVGEDMALGLWNGQVSVGRNLGWVSSPVFCSDLGEAVNWFARFLFQSVAQRLDLIVEYISQGPFSMIATLDDLENEYPDLATLLQALPSDGHFSEREAFQLTFPIFPSMNEIRERLMTILQLECFQVHNFIQAEDDYIFSDLHAHDTWIGTRNFISEEAQSQLNELEPEIQEYVRNTDLGTTRYGDTNPQAQGRVCLVELNNNYSNWSLTEMQQIAIWRVETE